MKFHQSSRPLGEKLIRFFIWYYCYCSVQLDSSLPTLSSSSIRTTSTSTRTGTLLFVNAVITIVETHQTFANTIDTNYGRSLMTGYEYYSRLQMLSSNPSLCLSSDTDSSSTEKNYSIVIPSDQLPVTLLVAHRSTSNSSSSSSSSNTIVREDCTLLEKIQYALTHIQPPGRVKYLIVATSDDNVEEEEEDGMKKRHPNHFNSDDRFVNDIHHNNKYVNYISMQSVLQEQQQQQQQQQQQETPKKHHLVRTSRTTQNPLLSLSSLIDIRRSKKDKTNPNQRTDIPLYIIHVSIATYNDLYSIVQRQSQNTVLEGGTQISVDNNRHSHRYYNGNGNEQNQTLLFTALIAFVTAGVCFFIILLCGSSDWDEEAAAHHADNGGQPHTRPTRQRLTREQVRNLFPIYRYDGQSKLYRILAFPTPSPTVPSAAVPSDSLQQPLLSSSSTTDEQPLHHQQEVIDNMMLDVCSICLDEYEIHDKVRVLPCHHTFHSKCVGRWLSERSAVCPLCKEDLYVEPEPVESEQETAGADTNNTNSTNADNNNNNNGSTSPSETAVESLPRFNHLWRRFLQQMEILPPTTVTSPSTTITAAPAITMESNTNITTMNNHTDVEMPIDTTIMVESNQPIVAASPNITTPTEFATATNTSRISSSWWSRMFPLSTSVVPVVQSTSSPPLNEPHSLTEPLLLLQQQQDDVFLEPTTGSSVVATVTTNSNTLPLEASTIPMDNSNIVNDIVVPSEDSVLSSTIEVPTDSISDQITIIDADQRIEKSDTSYETTIVDMSVTSEAMDPLQNLSSSLQEYSV